MRWINTKPSRGAQLALTLLPFVLLALAYAFGSAARLAIPFATRTRGAGTSPRAVTIPP